MPKKKPWSPPMVRRLPVTDELLSTIASANGTTAEDLRDLIDLGSGEPPQQRAGRAR